MTEHEEEGRDREERVAEGRRAATTDRALVRLDEKEIKARMVEAVEAFTDLGFAVHLISMKVKTARSYTLALYPDGVESIPNEKVQVLADEYGLDVDIERDPRTGDGWAVVLTPRWKRSHT